MPEIDAVYVVLTHDNCFVGVFATPERARAEAATGRYGVDRVELDDADHGFDLLMEAADAVPAEHYPPDVFVGGSDADPGVRLAVALRDCRAALAGRTEADR